MRSHSALGAVALAKASLHAFLNYNPLLAASRSGEPMHSPLDLWSMAFVFVLATFVGFQVIQNVSRLLHTPLMSLTNAISAIAVVGSILVAGEQHTTFTTILGTFAVAASMTNIVSGFMITDRMLRMFRERRRQ
jgi:NAD(P) transhydrogenase subunit alpha